MKGSALLGLLLTAAAALAGEPVIGFRNGGTGAYPDADPPLEWSVTKNVRWRWPGSPIATSISSPIVVGKRLFTVARPMSLICIDKDSGKELWRRDTHLPDGAEVGDVARKMHAACVRDGRIYELSSRVPAKGRKGVHFGREIRGLEKMLKSKNLSEADRAYYNERIAEREAILADGEANKESYEKELAELQAAVPDRKSPGFRVIGYPTGASPASDGERVFAVFSPGLVVCYDLDGNLLWLRGMVHANGRQATGSWGNYDETPQVAAGKLLVSLGSIAQCLDARTGEVLWDRAFGKGKFFAAASPAIGRSAGVHYFMFSSGEVGLLEDGKTLLTANTDRLCRYFATAVSADGRTLSAVRDAVRLPATADGTPELLWSLPDSALVGKKGMHEYVYGGSHQYCAPVIHDGILYYHCTHSAHSLAALDLETGEQIYRTPAGSFRQTYSDLVLAGEYLFMFRGGYEGSFEGICQIMKAGREFGHVGENRLEKVVSNDPVFEGRRMYMRTLYSLFCIEEPEEAAR